MYLPGTSEATSQVVNQQVTENDQRYNTDPEYKHQPFLSAHTGRFLLQIKVLTLTANVMHCTQRYVLCTVNEVIEHQKQRKLGFDTQKNDKI